MAEKGQLVRHYLVSYSVYSHVTHTISINQIKLKLSGLIALSTVDSITARAAQEWYLTNMGDLPKPTDPSNPLADYQVMITGMMLLEADEDGTPYPYMIGA